MRDLQVSRFVNNKRNKTNGDKLAHDRLFQTNGKFKPRWRPNLQKFLYQQLAVYRRKHPVLPPAVSVVSREGNDTIEEAWKLVEKAKTEIIFDPHYRDVILVVGNTGTGKTTLVQFIATDMSKLSAVEYPKFSGNMLIQDEDGKISKPGEPNTSKTLYPELVVSAGKDMAFYDCPGFKDSRGTAVDMATAYMTKMVFENSQKIKVHITVEWQTAIGQSGRGGPFIEAIERVGEFIRDAAKFKDGFSMVATKVPKVTREDEDGNDIVVPDEVLIKTIGDYIVDNMIPGVIAELKTVKDEKKKKNLENALVIFTALSNSTKGTYNRIGLLRNPQKEGPLDKSPLMQKSRVGILNAIKKETVFMAVSEDDFGIGVSDTTRLEMMKIVRDLDNEIQMNMEEIGESIITDVYQRMRASKDWVELSASLAMILEIVAGYKDALKSMNRLTTEFVKNLQFDLTSIGVAVPENKFQLLLNNVSYLEFLEVMLEENLSEVPDTSLDNSTSFITQAIDWYDTLYQILDSLSNYIYQEDTTKYNVANLDHWGQTNKPQGLRVSAQTFDKFAKLLNINTKAIDGFKLDEERMNELNSIVVITLASTPNIEVTSNGTLLAQGHFILLSHVLKEYKKNERKVKMFNLNATYAVYIDTSTFTASGCHMFIAAPNWHITENATVTLDGKHAESISAPAESGKPGNRGEDGVPGFAGHPAGNFFGFANNIYNAKQLTISARGGDGGNGQAGGSGGDGIQGIDAAYPTDAWQIHPDGKEGKDYKLLSYAETNKFFYKLKEWSYYIYGEAATNGESGGNGGVGGFGGIGGIVNLLNFSYNRVDCPIIQNSEGRVGDIGVGSRGGNGAKNGKNMKAYYWHTVFGDYRINAEWSVNSCDDTGYSSNGHWGESGANDKGRPPKIPQLPESIMNTFLIDFKGYILGVAAKTPLLRDYLQKFLHKINESSEIKKLYDISTFLYEMNTLESNFYAIHNRMNLTPFYTSLLNHVRHYADEHKNETKQVQKLVLGTIYTSCLGKICSLGLEYKAHNIIIDLTSHIDITLRRVNELVEMDRRVAIKGFQKSYNDAIEVNVKEANQLIATKVNPAIEKSMRAMNDVLDNLVDETLEKLEDAETTIEELKELQAQMERNVIIHGILNLVKLGGVIAGFFGPIGAAVGAVVTGGATIIDSLVVDPDIQGGSPILLPLRVESTINGFGGFINGIRDKKIKQLEAQLALIQKEIDRKPAKEKEDYRDLEQKVKELKQKLEAEKNSNVPEDDEDAIAAQSERIRALREDLTGTLKKKETKLQEQIDAGNKDKEKTLKGVKKIGAGVKLISASLETYDKFKDNQKKLDSIADALQEAEQAVSMLQDYEENIYATLFPMVRNMRDDIKKVMESLSGKSQVALDVTKWEVQSMLNNIKFTLNLAMEGFESQSEMTVCFDQLIEALNLLIHIYDRLENYHDQQALGDYIANIGAAGSYRELLQGTEYEEGVRKLDMTIQSNLVLLEYENAMHAFKQWVFPFAQPYLESSTFPESMKPAQDKSSLRELVVMADKQMKDVRDHVTRYWSTIPYQEKFFFTAKFYSNEKLGGPFYMWTKKHHEKEIQAFFKGEEITLLADVWQSQQFVKERKAIKFALVYLRFLLDGADKKRQEKFEDVMEYFVINMVYTGVSYYEFQDQIYKINGDPVTLTYGFKRDSLGVPEIQCTSRDKLLKGDLLLSPFGLWTIQLIADREEAFTMVKEFVNEVSLELAGTGNYIYDPKNELVALELRPQDFYNVDAKRKEELNFHLALIRKARRNNARWYNSY